MNWLLAVVAITGALAAPVVAGVVAPGLMTNLAQSVSVNHHHFVIGETVPIRTDRGTYEVTVRDADLYELPLNTQAILRGSIVPPPSDADLRQAFAKAIDQYDIPLLGYDIERYGTDVVVKATLPAGVLASLSPQYRDLVERYAS